MVFRCQHCGSTNIQKRGLRGTKQRVFCNEVKCRRSSTLIVAGEVEESDFTPTKRKRLRIEKGKRFLVTSAMNNTPVDQKFWGACKKYAEENEARILVIPVRYKNPTSRLDPQDDDNDVWWPDELVKGKYLVEGELHLHKYLRLLGQVRVQATALNPLTGLEGLTGPASGVVGHAQIAMKTIATPQEDLPKQMYTTGSVSSKEGAYSKTKAGIQGHFHHSLGCVVVEKGHGDFYMRSCVGDSDGGFFDLNRYYTAKSVKQIRAEALVTGDEHGWWADKKVMGATYTRPDSLANACRPKKIVRHDIVDSFSVSHWHRQNPLLRYLKTKTQYGSLEDELKHGKEHIEKTTPLGSENLIVASNHDDHILRWLNESEWRNDLRNAAIYHELWAGMLREAKLDDATGEIQVTSPLAAWLGPRISKKCPTRFLKRDEPVMIAGILVSLHGDKGPNGARGSIRGFSKLGVKVVTGHPHTPGIEKGAYQVGTSTGHMGYASGPSSWFNVHCLIGPNGKRQLVPFVNGRFRV